MDTKERERHLGRRSKNELAGNKQALDDAAVIQKDTKDALRRIQRQATETQEVGASTLQELYEQRQQWDRIQQQGDRVQDQLKRSIRLQNQLSRWSLRLGSGRAARRQAEQVRSFERKQEMIQQQRQQRMEQRLFLADDHAPPAQSSTPSSTVVVRPHGKNKQTKRSSSSSNKKSNEQMEEIFSSKKEQSLLYGLDRKGTVDTKDDDDDDDDAGLKQLAETDKEINQELDNVNVQLDEILYLAQSLGREVQSQTVAADDVLEQVDKNMHQQRIVNYRAGRFLTGKVRKQYEQASATHATGFW